jgi:hypothetical protein
MLESWSLLAVDFKKGTVAMTSRNWLYKTLNYFFTTNLTVVNFNYLFIPLARPPERRLNSRPVSSVTPVKEDKPDSPSALSKE